jgi:hypothetical protein
MSNPAAASADAPASSKTSPLAELAGAVLGDLRTSVTARIEIARIEGHQAVAALLRSLWAGCAALMLVLVGWWAACSALVVLAVDAGVAWVWALLGAAGANAILAFWAATRARALAAQVGMPHTRKLLFEPGNEIHRNEAGAHDAVAG